MRWSPEHNCFVAVRDAFTLGPNDRLDLLPHDLQLQGVSEDRFELTIGATLTRQS